MNPPINDGGPAFPKTESRNFSDAGPCPVKDSTARIMSTGGMSLRDWFAGQALAGNLASQTPESHWAFGALQHDQSNDLGAQTGIAKLCYDIADAMISAREAKS